MKRQSGLILLAIEKGEFPWEESEPALLAYGSETIH
jgi:hypothetical protein